MLDFNSIIIRDLEIRDLESYFYWKLPTHEFHRFNGPYYKKLNEHELKVKIEAFRCLGFYKHLGPIVPSGWSLSISNANFSKSFA